MMDTSMSAVAIIINDEDRVLTITHRTYGGPALPGGKVEEGESPIAACAREVEEEVGLLVKPEHLTLIATGLSATGRQVFVFHVAEYNGTPMPMEGGEVKWMAWDDLRSESPFGYFYSETFPYGVQCLRQAHGR